MIFTVELTIITYILLGVMLFGVAVYCVWQWHRTRTLQHFVDNDERVREYLDDEQLPSVTILVYAHNDADYLSRFLPLLLHQDYPDFEVIVTDDSSTDGTKDLLSDMLAHFDNLRASFVPEGTRSLSRKKLAIMLGVKAARGEVIVTTSANCRVMSEQWLRLIARNFIDGKDVVIGYSHYRYNRDRSYGRLYRVFDTVQTGVQYLCSAIHGKPYRGISDNLAYRRQVFFDNTGFSRSLDQRWGEDDVFVSEIARGDNTRVEIAEGSQMAAYYNNMHEAHHALKLRRDFTSHFVSTRVPMRVQAIMSAILYATIGCGIAAVALNYRNLAVIAAVAVILILLWVVAALAVKRQCKLLEAPALSWTVLWLAVKRPLINIVHFFQGRRLRKTFVTSIID